MSYNASLALALRYAPQIGTPSDSPATVPTLTNANAIFADATNETAAGFRAARLVDAAASLTGLALAQAKQIESMLTSGYCLLAKGSIGKDATATAFDLLRRARELIKDLDVNRESWIAEGAAEEGTRTNPFVRSRQVDDADPNFDFTPGTGDRPYAENLIWPEDGSEL